MEGLFYHFVKNCENNSYYMSLMAWNISTRMHERGGAILCPKCKWDTYSHDRECILVLIFHNIGDMYWLLHAWDVAEREFSPKRYLAQWTRVQIPCDPTNFFLSFSVISVIKGMKNYWKIKKNEAKIQKFVLEKITLKMQVFQLYLVDQASQQVVGTIFSNVRMIGRLSLLK